MNKNTNGHNDLFLSAATASNLMKVINDEVQAEIANRSHPRKEDTAFGTSIETMLSQSARIKQWAFDLKRLNYSPSASELQTVQNLLVDNALLSRENRPHMMTLTRNTSYGARSNKILKNWGYFTVLQDQMMESIVGMLMKEINSNQN